jgi:cyanophycin synthetase
MHVAPSEGHAARRRRPGDRHAVPARVAVARADRRITGTNGKTTTARMLAHITKMAGYTPGLTTTDGVYIDGQRTVEGDMTGPVSARMVLPIRRSTSPCSKPRAAACCAPAWA